MNELKRKTMKDIDRIDETSGPVAPGVGAVVGGASRGIAGGPADGAVAGGMSGPIGTAVGALIGSVARALAGKDMADAVDPGAEDAYWRDNHSTLPYARESDYDEALRRRRFTPGTRTALSIKLPDDRRPEWHSTSARSAR